MIWRTFCIALLMQVAAVGSAVGHALEPGFLDLRQLTGETWQVFWRIPDVSGQPMDIQVGLPKTCTPSSEPELSYDGKAWVAAWITDCADGLTGHEVSVPGLSLQATDVLVRVQRHDASPATFRLTPDETVFEVPATPTTFDVFISYGQLGVEHILSGWDHLLFVFALLVLIGDTRRLVGAITAFTVAHSITLALAALGQISVPGPPVEATIALSIIFLATEILKHHDGELRLSERYPWIVSFSFGLLHGLGFAGALKEIGLPEGEVPAALLSFNLGVEAGQLLFVTAVLIAAAAGRRVVRNGAILGRTVLMTPLGYGIGCISTFWFVERIIAF